MAAIVGMIAFAGVVLFDKRNIAFEMKSLNELARLGPVVSALVHELQKERGAATGFIGSKGKLFARRLSVQRQRTNEAREALAEALEEFDAAAHGEAFVARLKTARRSLDRLEIRRGRITDLAMTTPEVVAYYSRNIADLLGIVEEMAVLSPDANAAGAITAYTALLQAKERAGLERAMGSAGFGAGRFEPFIHRRFVQLLAEQETFLGIFRHYATDAQKAFYENTVIGEAVNEVHRMRAIAIEGAFTGDTKGVDGSYWFATITRKIDLLKTVEDRIAADLRALTGARQSAAEFNVYFEAVLAGVLLLVMLALVYAIVGQKRADGALRASEHKYRSLFEHANDGIFILDPETRRFLDANAIALERLGYTKDELLELTIEALVPDDEELDGEEITRRIREAGGLVFERNHMRKDGSELPVEISSRIVEYGDRQVIQSFARDITERKEVEEQIRQVHRLEAVGQLTGGVAHDFNNLLAIIQGNAELLQDRLGDDSLVEAVMRAADRGSELVQRLLAFSRQQPLRSEVTDLNALVAGTADLMRRTLGGSVAIHVETAVDLWDVEVDSGQLENALLNLAINARDAMPDGGKLVIETANVTLDSDGAAGVDAAPGDYAVLAVSDTGTGMPPEVLEHAFEPFFTTKDVGQGSGLGLSMAYGFAKQSGGSLWIESEPGEGTVVRMYLPRAKQSAAAAAEPAPSSAASYEGSGNILVVEDNPDVRSLVVQILTKLGYETTEAENGVTALAMLEDGRQFDLMFTDIVMPGGMSGIKLCQEAHTRFPGLKLILTSGYNNEAIADGGQLEFKAPFVRKPYRKSELGRVVREVLSNPA